MQNARKHKILDELVSNFWFQMYSRGIARKFGFNRKIPNWSKVCEDVMVKIPPFNQRHIPACVSHTTATMMQIEWYRRTGKLINFSPRFLDIISWTDNLDINAGRNPDVVMELSMRIGCCTEDLLPNDTTFPLERYRDRSLITDAMYTEASKYKMANLNLASETLFDTHGL